MFFETRTKIFQKFEKNIFDSKNNKTEHTEGSLEE